MTGRRAGTAAAIGLPFALIATAGWAALAGGGDPTAARHGNATEAVAARGTPAPPAPSGPGNGGPSNGPGYGPGMMGGGPSGGPGYGPGHGPGMMGPSYGPWHGPGMMGGPSYGPGMMGTGPYGMAGRGPVATLPQARSEAQRFADRLGLHVGEVMQFRDNFYAELNNPDGRGATEVLIDPRTGTVGIEYGPAMMWNTRYGPHAIGNAPAARVSAAEARRIADQWLKARGTGLTAGPADTFPGYYTLHTMRDGKIVGMLSVNAYTGSVWYHTWHGTFIAMTGR